MTHFGPPGTPRGRPGPGPGPGVHPGSEKFFSRKNQPFSKTHFMRSWMVFGPPGPILDPLGPPGRAHLAPKCPQNGQNGTQKRLKNRKKSENFFCSKSLPEGSWMVSRPQNPLKTCNGPQLRSFWNHFACKIGQKGPKKHVFLK